MVESNRQVRISDPLDRFDEAINDPGLYPAYQYDRPESRQLEPLPQDRVPLFLSEYDQPYDQDGFDDEGHEYTFGSKQEKPRTARLVIGLVAVTAFAATVGYFSIDTMRSVLVNAKASLASVAPSFGDATPSEPAAPPPRVAQAAAPEPRIAAPEAQAVYRGRPTEANVAPPAPAPASKPMDAFASMPSRDDITAAYQSAVKGGQAAPAAKSSQGTAQGTTQVAAVAPTAPAVVAVAPPAPQVAAPGARRMDPDELAGFLKRAKSLLAVGDIASARLLLERAAEAQEAEAALMLATTYDPQVIGNQDMRSITADPAMARQWYQKAAALGSTDARRRLSELRN
jgi:hypothetical protein